MKIDGQQLKKCPLCDGDDLLLVANIPKRPILVTARIICENKDCKLKGPEVEHVNYGQEIRHKAIKIWNKGFLDENE